MTRWLKTEVTLQWNWRIFNACRVLSLAMFLCCLLSITACATATPESGVQYFKRRAGVDLTAYGRELGGLIQPADRFNEQPDLSSGKIRSALLAVYPPGTPREMIFPKNETQPIQLYGVRYARLGEGKYTSRVEGGATREFEMAVDSPRERYQRLVENATIVVPSRHQLSFDFSADNTLLDIKVNHASGK